MNSKKRRPFKIFVVHFRTRQNETVEISFLASCETAAWEYAIYVENAFNWYAFALMQAGNNPHPDYLICMS